VIEIVAILGRGFAAAELALDVDQIDHRGAGLEMIKSHRLIMADQFATQHVAIESDHGVDISGPQHDMIDLRDVDRVWGCHDEYLPDDRNSAMLLPSVT